MKKLMKLAYMLIGTALLLCGCSEDIFPGAEQQQDDVTISLTYSDASPRDIVVNSRATEAEERHLDNLYIYIFDGNGNLKGYKGIEDASQLDQSTSDSNKAKISGIKTRTGDSYIYAVANIGNARYPINNVSLGKIEDGKLPIALDETTAQAGGYDFTLDKLKNLSFLRNQRDQILIQDAFLMSGAVQKGKMLHINEAGSITNGENDIRLSRIVSKVKFTIKSLKEKGISRTFKLGSYDIMNIAMSGSLIGTIDGNTKKKIDNIENLSDITGISRGVNDVDENGVEFFEFYVPENLQDPQHTVTEQHMREDDTQSTPKVFTNAPQFGTYVVLKGKYEETKNSTTRSADVTYYVHLGDCSADVNDYNVERNCKYTYNITVAGVDKIIIEAQKAGNEQPGSEGVVLEYGNTGKNLTLDSHYEYMVMRFYQEDIYNLKHSENNLGYYYQVYALGKNTDPINVGATIKGKKNDVNTDWIQFAIKCDRDGSTSKYNNENDNRGEACSYPGTSYSKNLYDIEGFLQYLYNNAESNSGIWTSGYDSNKKKNCQYIDATCFISENYYDNLTWDKYVNDVNKRAFYVANQVDVSKDGRSVYAQAQYGLTQYNIQTFYDRNQAGSITAYGCETINDEEGKNGFYDDGVDGTQKSGYQSIGTDKWNGRSNMLQDIFYDYNYYGDQYPNQNWKELKTNKSLVKACMSRNRDLNGDGKITKDEVRWYAPAVNQYVGLWIGEEVMSTEAKLFNKSTSTLNTNNDPGCRMLYYTSTNGINTYFAEEGMATNNHDGKWKARLLRCVRNLKSNDKGYDQKPDEFWTTSNEKKLVKLDKVDSKALIVGGNSNELMSHTERSVLNKPAKSFLIADDKYSKSQNGYQSSMYNVVNGNYKCNGHYSQNGGDTKWRVPNQREMSVMFLIDPSLIQNTYCRTIFSNTNFRKSWTYTSVFTMATEWNDYSSGYVRCIQVKE